MCHELLHEEKVKANIESAVQMIMNLKANIINSIMS